MFATKLKDLAVELGIHVSTSTQLNAKGDDNTNIKNEASLAGSRSIINKADFGCIVSNATKDELDILEPVIGKMGICPNIVTDVYKVRSGEWNQVKIWSKMDKGTLRKIDYFITDSRLQVMDIFSYNYDYSLKLVDDDEKIFKELIAKLNKGEI